jgi:hypothetical protein
MGKTVNEAEDLITFSRASGAYGFTKVGYGPELVTNGDFYWLLTGWTLTPPDGPATWGGIRHVQRHLFSCRLEQLLATDFYFMA